MQLKEYQKATLEQISEYLKALKAERERAVKAAELGINHKWDEVAWEKFYPRERYNARYSAAGNAVPNICLKIPTGGGKTFLAVNAIDLINTWFLV